MVEVGHGTEKAYGRFVTKRQINIIHWLVNDIILECGKLCVHIEVKMMDERGKRGKISIGT